MVFNFVIVTKGTFGKDDQILLEVRPKKGLYVWKIITNLEICDRPKDDQKKISLTRIELVSPPRKGGVLTTKLKGPFCIDYLSFAIPGCPRILFVFMYLLQEMRVYGYLDL